MYDTLIMLGLILGFWFGIFFFLEILPKWYKKEVIDYVDEEQNQTDEPDFDCESIKP